MTFEKAARDHAKSRGALGTRALYCHDLDRWIAFCASRGVDPARPTLEAASSFRDELEFGDVEKKKEKQKALTIRRTLSSLSSMYEAAMNYEEPFSNWNPFKKLVRPSSDIYSRTKAVTEEDANKLIESARREPSGRDFAIMLLLYTTGIRRATVAKLERAEIERRGGKTVIGVVVKGSKRREVVLAGEAAEALDRWLSNSTEKKSPWIFPAARREGAIHPTTINKIIAGHCEKTGLKVKGRKGGVHPHMFRAAFATSAFDAGVPLNEVQASLHHSSPLTSQRYDRGQRGGEVTDKVSKFRKGEK